MINIMIQISDRRRFVLRCCMRTIVVVMSWIPTTTARGQDRVYNTGHGLDQQALYDRYDWPREKIGLDPGNF